MFILKLESAMRFHPSLLLAGTLAASLVCAENLTQANVEKAQSIIDAAVEAYGGADTLSNMNTVIIQNEAITWAVDQSRKAEPPWDQNPASGISAIDFENDVFVTRNHGTGGGFEFDGATVINGDESYQFNYRAGTIARIAEPDFDTASGPFFRVTPAFLVRNVNERSQNAYYLGDVTVDDKDYEVVGFSMAVGPAISLYFDKDDHLLRRSERVFAGVGLVEYRFTDYESVAGIPFNRNFELYLNGDPNMQRTNVKTQVNVPLGDLTAADKTLEPIPEVTPDPLTRQEVADGVYLIGGSGTYAMFVDMGDHIVAAGGTAGIPERIQSLREVVGDKPIRYGVMTHHHFDHVMGVSSYEAEGATLVSSAAHEKIVRRAADNGDELKLETVTDRMVLESDSRRIEIIDIGPTAHTEHLLVAYLPEEGILFEADHFAMPRSGPVPPAVSSTRTFAAALQQLDIEPQKILSAHSPKPGTMQDLRAALDKEATLVSQK